MSNLYSKVPYCMFSGLIAIINFEPEVTSKYKLSSLSIAKFRISISLGHKLNQNKRNASFHSGQVSATCIPTPSRTKQSHYCG